MRSSSNSPAYMILFGRVATPCRVTLLLAVLRVPSYARRQSTGYTLIISSHSNSRLCDIFLFLVCYLSHPYRISPIKFDNIIQYLIRTRSSRLKTQLLHLSILTTKISTSIWAASKKRKAHRQFVYAGMEIPTTLKFSLSVRRIARTGLARSRSRHVSQSKKTK
jgi:hypothetical protein